MAQIIRINSLGLVNFHRFQHTTSQVIEIVECSDREYADLGLQGAGPPPVSSWPSPRRDYTWVGSQGGADKFGPGKYDPDLGEMYFRDNRFRIRPHDPTERMIATDPTRDTITGDTTSRDTTITISPDPIIFRGAGVAQSGTASTIVLAASHTFPDNALNGMTIEILRGTGEGQERVITSNTLIDNTCHVTPNWITDPLSDSAYLITGAWRVVDGDLAIR